MVLDWISHIKIEVFFITDCDVHLIILRSGLLIGQSKDLHCVTLRSEREYESGCMSKFSKFTSGTIAGKTTDHSSIGPTCCSFNLQKQAQVVCVNRKIYNFFKLASSYFRRDHKCLKYANMSLRSSWCYLVITKKSSGGNITLMMVRVKFHSVLGDSLTCCRGT